MALLTHRVNSRLVTAANKRAGAFCSYRTQKLQQVRAQIGSPAYLAARLDRKWRVTKELALGKEVRDEIRFSDRDLRDRAHQGD